MPCSNSVSGGRSLKRFVNFAEFRFATGVDDAGFSAAAHDVRAHENATFVRCASAVSAEISAWSFFARISFASQRRFVNEKVARFEQPAIGRNNRAGRKQHDIAGNDFFRSAPTFPCRRAARALLFRRPRTTLPTAFAARCSCQKPSNPLAMTIERIIAASVTSWRKVESTAAPIRMRMIGLVNCRNSSIGPVARSFDRSRFAPKRVRRPCASSFVRPSADVPRRRQTASIDAAKRSSVREESVKLD